MVQMPKLKYLVSVSNVSLSINAWSNTSLFFILISESSFFAFANEISTANASLCTFNKMKDGAIAHLSNQLMALTVIMQDLERRRR